MNLPLVSLSPNLENDLSIRQDRAIIFSGFSRVVVVFAEPAVETLQLQFVNASWDMSSILEAHNVTVVGRGEEVLVLCHGFGTDQSVWKYVIPHFVDEFKLILFDTMGAGTTDPDCFSANKHRYSSLYGYADDLLAILDELHVDSCVYIGHSVAGMVSCLASIERPDLFSKIIMLSSSPRYYSPIDSNQFSSGNSHVSFQ